MPCLLVTVNIIPSSLILVTLMMDMIHSSKMSVLTRATWCHIPEDSSLQAKQELGQFSVTGKKLPDGHN
jgi:hypothetical protein